MNKNKPVTTILNELFHENCSYYQFNIMDLPKITADAESILRGGGTIEAATNSIINMREKYKIISKGKQ